MIRFEKATCVQLFILLLLVWSGWAVAEKAVSRTEHTNLPKAYGLSPMSAVTTPGSTVTVFGDGFSPNTRVYFDGHVARQTVFLSPSRVEVITPYLRPGEHIVRITQAPKIVAMNAVTVVRVEIPFKALPSAVDSEIENALLLADANKVPEALHALEGIASAYPDYQVRAFTHYQEGQLYFAVGDWDRWYAENMGIFLDAKQTGWSVQTAWPFRLALARSHYYLDMGGDPGHEGDQYDDMVALDVTGATEPRFERALLNARIGRPLAAQADISFCLAKDPGNARFAALGAFCAAAASEDHARAAAPLEKARSALSSDPSDYRARTLLGEAEYMDGQVQKAMEDWAEAGQTYSLGADLALRLARKHLWRGDQRTASMFLAEVKAMGPGSAQAQEAAELSQGMPSSQ